MNIPVHIFIKGGVDNELYALRLWPAVPRIGDKIIIDKDGERPWRVVDLIWRNHDDNTPIVSLLVSEDLGDATSPNETGAK